MAFSDFKMVSTPNMLDAIKLGVNFVVTEYDREWDDYLTYVCYINEPKVVLMDAAFTTEDAINQHRKCCLNIGIRPEEIVEWNG